MQQTTSSLSEGDSSLCNYYPLHYTYLANCPTVSDEYVHLGYKHNLEHVYAIRWCELHQWLSAAAHVTRQSSTASVRWHHGSSSEHCCIVLQSDSFQFWAIKAALFLVRLILRCHMQYAIDIGINCDFQVSQGSVETYWRSCVESLWYACTKFPQESDSERIW